jgi:hypothetical protein
VSFVEEDHDVTLEFLGGYALDCSTMLFRTALVYAVVTMAKPFFKEAGLSTWLIGNDGWNMTIGETFGTKLFFGGRELVGKAKGHYAGYGECSIEVH